MEEIWKDIPDLSSLQNPNNSFDGMDHQESQARPILYQNYNLNPVFQATTTNVYPASNNVVLLTPQGNSLPSSSHHPAVSNMACSSQQQLGLGLGMGMGMQSPGSARKRIAISCENDDHNNISSSSRSDHDRHTQRLIKNRESAARSRERKEAHTVQLEDEVKKLKAENAELKKQQQLREAAQALNKHTLNRTSSSPF